jgi:hypothetical protein
MTSYEMTSAFDYFTCLPKYRVVLYKICHYRVWPDNARTHLREKHSRLSKAERLLICDELQAWQGATHSHEQFEIPKAVDQPVQGSTSVPGWEAMSTRAWEMFLCLPFDGQSEEALASSTQLDRDWEMGRFEGSGVTSCFFSEASGCIEACSLPALFPHRAPYKLLQSAFRGATWG